MARVSEILNAAADLLEKPGAWTQQDYAFDPDGVAVDARNERASCFCALGAIRHAGGYPDDVNPAASVLGQFVGDLVCDWNDAPGRTQAEVVAALRAAATHQTGEPG
jgi:hypothetical protein